MNRKKIFAISGSTRSQSSNESILKTIAKLFSDRLEIQIFKQLTDLPHFNPDLDKENPPEAIRNFRNMIRESDGVIICTPEYIFSLPAALKNAIEWMVSTTIFTDKPSAFIIASGLGERSFESLTVIMNTLQAKMDDQTRLLLKGSRSNIDENGYLSDPSAIEEIKQMIHSLETKME
ncbi:NADPH-dependent FMN reductase [Leptospira sp. 'Mane']|uniref:NADPH-dependent FMN reductase n=1 Tax=Leptospira sp. 'Mane' TaxID=3387407 RepID=UPI00398B93FF